jgi:hypothetical protein
MTTYAWPSGGGWLPSMCSITLKPNTREFESQYSGAYQGVDLMGERFVMSLRLPAVARRDAGAREAFFNRLRGVHFVSTWHFARPQPLGTQRGAPTLSADVAQGATSLPMSNLTTSATWLAGDMLGIGGQLFQVAADVTVSGTTATVTVVNRARAALSNGAAVTWDRPTAEWRLTAPVVVSHVPGLVEPVDLDLVQVW